MKTTLTLLAVALLSGCYYTPMPGTYGTRQGWVTTPSGMYSVYETKTMYGTQGTMYTPSGPVWYNTYP